jgi:NlpC/P60 family/Bacterial dipeptidyl-peptidase Sh3 domain
VRVKLDRRVTPHSGRVAHVSLQGRVQAEAFVAGEACRVTVPLVDLCDGPDGTRDRQLLLGDAFLVIERREGWAYGQSDRGDYCGWVPEATVGWADMPTHRVRGLATHVYAEPWVQARDVMALTMGARVCVTAMRGAWAETSLGFVPAMQLARIGDWESDPVAVAERFLGVPYLWGGNSSAGLDCSGLVQAAWLACGRDCPGDSDQQRSLGRDFRGRERRGDLIFWQGHVAIVTGPDRIIHANGHTMDVAHEGLADAIARIGTDVLARRR